MCLNFSTNGAMVDWRKISTQRNSDIGQSNVVWWNRHSKPAHTLEECNQSQYAHNMGPLGVILDEVLLPGFLFFFHTTLPDFQHCHVLVAWGGQTARAPGKDAQRSVHYLGRQKLSLIWWPSEDDTSQGLCQRDIQVMIYLFELNKLHFWL